MKKNSFLLCCILFLGIGQANSQDFSNKGTDFWLGYGYHVNMSGNAIGNASGGGTQEMILYFTSDKNATVTVDIPGVGYSQTYTVLANQVTVSNPLPKTGAQDSRVSTYGKLNRGIHLTSDVPIVAYCHIYNSSVSGATLLFPTNTLGKEYYSVNYTQSSNASLANCFFFVIATEDNTSIEITPSAANLNGLAVGVPSTPIPLNKGEIYSVMGVTSGSTGTDLTGSRIRSISNNGSGGCKKIAVFSGAGKLSIGGSANGSADNTIAQAFPAVAWGKKYLTAPTGSQPNNFYRVCVTDPNTVVKLNGTVLPKASLINNFYYQFKNGNATGTNPPVANLIESDIPVMVAQYITTQGQEGNPNTTPFGDPEMIYLSPVEQTINKITVYSASRFNILQSYINVVIKGGGVNSFIVDGISKTALFQPHPQDASYSYATIPVSSGSHAVYSDSGFNAIAYGFGSAESYGYNAGTNVKDFSQTASFQNPYKRLDSAISCVNTPFEFSIPLNFVPNTLRWEFSTAPNISPNTNIGTITSPAYDSTVSINGQTLYYFSPHTTYKFTQSNTGALRDTIKMYTTSATPDGCGSTDQLYTIPVKVIDLPLADFTTNNSGCVSDSVRFFDATNTLGNGAIEIGLWDFGDGSSDSAFYPVKKYAIGGTYNIRYRPINSYGCIGDTTIVKTYSALPLASFSYSDSCVNQSITFNDLSSIATGSIVKWYWDYGNGTKDTLTASSPRTITYTSTGPVTVSLTVETNTGCLSLPFTKDITIRPLPEPGFILPEVCQNDAVTQFFDSTKIADNTSFTYLWNFNAGTPAVSPAPVPLSANEATAKDPRIKYSTPANYLVSLQVTSIYGCKTIITQPFTVNGSNPDPQFDVVNSTELCSNRKVVIRNKSKMLDFGNVTRLEIFWDITDLTKKTVVEDPGFDSLYSYLYPDFQTPATKNYTIRLVAYSGASGSSCNKKIEHQVTILQSPKVAFSKVPGICLDATPRLFPQASFNASVPNATGSPIFSGTGITNAATGLFNPVTAGVGGAYSIQYLSISDKGCRDSATQTITVWPSPTAKWGVQNIVCEKNSIAFTDSSVANYSNIVKRDWSFGDGVTADKQSTTSFNYQYNTANNYTIGLRVTTDSGCISPLNEQVLKVNYLPRVAFTQPNIVCLPDGNATFTNTSTIPDGSEALFSYLWTFGDANNPSSWTLKDGKHQFSALGTYQVKQQVTTKDGCIDSAVQAFSNIFPQPKAAFVTTPAEICVNETIQFTDNSQGLTSAINIWKWDLAQGTSSSLQNPSKKFTDSGTYNIVLYAYNTQGCVSDTLTKSIIVHPYPVLDLGPNLVVLEGGQTPLKPLFVYGTNLQYLWTPSLYLSSDTARVPISTPLGDVTYKLTLTGIGNCSVTDDVFIKLLLAPLVPNAFSPNKDGINDTWKIEYLESYPGATVDVFNRYGQKVFSSNGYTTQWDGTFNGVALPIGTYYYIINPKNGRATIQGSVTIIK
ncbi:MAG: hypothetical protein CFE25_08975 [Chitinophagaceae bacterium BSSC1]|nr:MAG: hypothetical protein CFE25_08975 [Chitinophagaceae bacterium BSSC1]